MKKGSFSGLNLLEEFLWLVLQLETMLMSMVHAGGRAGVKGEAHSCRRKPETMLKPLICAATG